MSKSKQNIVCIAKGIFLCNFSVYFRSLGEFVYAVTAAEGIILSSLFIGRKQR